MIATTGEVLARGPNNTARQRVSATEYCGHTLYSKSALQRESVEAATSSSAEEVEAMRTIVITDGC